MVFAHWILTQYLRCYSIVIYENIKLTPNCGDEYRQTTKIRCLNIFHLTQKSWSQTTVKCKNKIALVLLTNKEKNAVTVDMDTKLRQLFSQKTYLNWNKSTQSIPTIPIPLISFLLLSCASVGDNTHARVSHFLKTVLNETCCFRSSGYNNNKIKLLNKTCYTYVLLLL